MRKFDIATVDRWKRDTANRVFNAVFADFGFLSLCPLKAVPDAGDPEMPMPLQRAVALVRAGVPLDSTYAPSSARRLVAQAGDYGIDLRAPPSQSDAKVVLLNPEERWVTTVADEIKRLRGFDRQFGSASKKP